MANIDELKSTGLKATLPRLKILEIFQQGGQRVIEAKYVFPGSTRAAVHGMNVRLADRLITAKIREKQQARIEYDTARKEGKTAALLEQHLPNVFQMNVANILPGDDVKVELRYTELLVPTSGNYQFVFPTVVGPRYNSPQSSQASASWVSQPVLRQGDVSPAAFDIHVALNTPMGIKEAKDCMSKLALASRPATISIAISAVLASTIGLFDNVCGAMGTITQPAMEG